MAENFYDNSFFPSLSVKSPDMVGALSSGYDLGRKMYSDQTLPGLMEKAAQGDTSAQAQAQALNPSAMYQSALGNQAQSTVQQQKLLTVARLSNGLKSALDSSADDASRQSAIDAFDNLAKQSGLPENPMLSDPNVPMQKKLDWVKNTAQQTQSTLMAATVGKGGLAEYIQSRQAQGDTRPVDQLIREYNVINPRTTSLPNGDFVQNGANGPLIANTTTNEIRPMGQPALAQPPTGPVSSPALSSPLPASPAASAPMGNAPLPVDGPNPVVSISDQVNSPQPTVSGLADLNQQQDQGSIVIPEKPNTPPIEQAKQQSLQAPGSPVNLPDGGFMMNGKYFDSMAKTNPKQEQETFNKTVEGYVDPKDGLDAQIKAAQNSINLAKQVQALSPNANSGELADYFTRTGSTLESLGLLPEGSKTDRSQIMKAITGQYAAGIMGGENNVKNVRNVREFDVVMSQAPQLTQTATGREKIAALTEAVAQAKLQSAQAYQQAISDRSIQNPEVKKQLQDSYGQALDSIPVIGIANYNPNNTRIKNALGQGATKDQIIDHLNKMSDSDLIKQGYKGQ